MATRRRSKPSPSRSKRRRPADIQTFISGGVRLRRTPVALARRFFQIVAGAASEAIAAEGVKPQHLAALVSLSKETGDPGIDQNGLAVRLGLERARISQLVDEMERLGLIDRQINGADRRARVLYLTPQGEQLRARVHPKGLAAQHGVLAGLLPADRERLFDLLTRVIQLNASEARASASARKQTIEQPISGGI